MRTSGAGSFIQACRSCTAKPGICCRVTGFAGLCVPNGNEDGRAEEDIVL